MNPCFIYKLLSIYIAACLWTNPAHSTGQGGSSESGGTSLTPNVTLIDLDLTQTESTEQYDYKKDGDVETFTANDEFAIQSYSEGTTEKWKSDGTKYYSSIKKAKFSVVSYTYRVTYYITGQQSNAKSFYDLDETSYLKYEMDENAKCKGIKYDGKEAWIHDPSKHGDPYPKFVVFSIKGNTLIVNFKESMDVLKFDRGSWNYMFSGNPEPKAVNIQSKTESGDYYYDGKNNVHTYKAKEDKLFNKVESHVVNGTEEVLFETYGPFDFAYEVLYDESNSNNSVVIIRCVNGLARNFKKTTNGKWNESSVTGSGFTLTADKVEILTETQPKSSPEVEQEISPPPPIDKPQLPNVTLIDLDLTQTESTEQYEYNQDGDVETFTAKVGFAFKKYADGINAKWESDAVKYLSRVVKNKHTVVSYKYETSDYVRDNSIVKIVTRVEDSKKRKVNDATKYEMKEEDGLLEYKFKDGSKCVKVSYEDKEVWSYDASNSENPYPQLIFFNVKNKTILLIFNETISIYQFENDGWKSTFSGKPEGVELDTKSKKDTDDWSYKKEDKVGTYTSKTGKFFNVVRQSADGWFWSSCGSCGSSSEQEIWKTEDKSEYATKVVVSGIGSKTKTVTIYLVSGLVKRINKDENNPWSELNPTTSGGSKPSCDHTTPGNGTS